MECKVHAAVCCWTTGMKVPQQHGALAFTVISGNVKNNVLHYNSEFLAGYVRCAAPIPVPFCVSKCMNFQASREHPTTQCQLKFSLWIVGTPIVAEKVDSSKLKTYDGRW